MFQIPAPLNSLYITNGQSVMEATEKAGSPRLLCCARAPLKEPIKQSKAWAPAQLRERISKPSAGSVLRYVSCSSSRLSVSPLISSVVSVSMLMYDFFMCGCVYVCLIYLYTSPRPSAHSPSKHHPRERPESLPRPSETSSVCISFVSSRLCVSPMSISFTYVKCA